MKLSAPRHVTWWIALIAGGLGALQQYRVIHLPVLGHFASLMILGAWALLILGTFLRGL